MTRTTLTLAFAASLMILAPCPAADDKPQTKDGGARAELLGGYTIVAGERYGEKEPAERIEGTTVRIAEDAIIVLDKEKKEVYAQTYKIDTGSKPWKITLKSKITPYTEKSNSSGEAVSQGLIEKEGDTIRLIYALPGGEAPTEFKTKQKQLMFVMKNERKSK